ncbi:MAG: hypothetical protein ACRYG2_13575 [Janthinobacterium lividum]
MSPLLPTIARAGLLGLTTGARSFSGIASQVAATPSLVRRQPERAFGHLRVKGLFGLLALVEVVGDKLPTAPSRLGPSGLVPRLVLAGVAAVLVARADDGTDRVLPGSAAVAVPVAVGASLAGAFLGHVWRGRATEVVGRDWPGAVAEDAVVLTLAAVATRL